MASGSKSVAKAKPVKSQTYAEIFVARSDGVDYDKASINAKIRGNDNVSDPLGDENEHVRAWMIKLGQAVKYNLGRSNDKTEYVVVFPDNYVIRHRSFEDTTKKKKPRDDPFVFGHPSGPSERYRSPAEFALHILWLLSNSQSHQDCSCPLCKRMVAAERGGTAVTATRGLSLASGPSTTATGDAKKPSGPSGSGGGTGSGSGSGSGSRTSSGTGSGTGGGAGGGGSSVFRAGELVWYQQSAWRLGIVLQVLAHDSDYRNNTHRIAPLGHLFLPQQDAFKLAKEMRPFLGFSVPTPMESLANMTYDDVNWPELAKQSDNQELIGLEASKFAAKKINASFSLFNKKQTISSTQHMFGGVFLGAEQMRGGDAIRVKSRNAAQTKPDVMSIKSIYSNKSEVNFVGNIYRLAEAPAAGQVEQPTGPAFVDDIALRTRVTGQPWFWALQVKDAVCKEEEVLGRFYVTDRLLEIVDPAAFQAELQKGVVMDALSALNARLQSGAVQYLGRKPTRMATIGQAISSPLVLGDDIVEDATVV